MIHQYVSDRGMPLVYWGAPRDAPIVTVENYCKWYGLHILYPNGDVMKVSFPDDGFVDHVPNPAAVERFADKHGYYLCTESLEMITGRWQIEVIE